MTEPSEITDSRIELKKTLKNETREREKLEQEKRDLERELSLKEKKIKKLEKEIDNNQTDLKEVQKTCDKLMDEKRELESKVRELSNRNLSLESENITNSTELKRLQKKLEKLEQEYSQLEKQSNRDKKRIEDLEKLEKRNKDLEKKNKEYSTTIEELETTNQQMNISLRKLKRENAENSTDELTSLMNSTKEESKKKQEELQKIIADLEKENRVLQENSKKVEKLAIDLKKHFENQISEAKKKLSIAENTIDTLRIQLKQLQKKNLQQRRDNEAYTQEDSEAFLAEENEEPNNESANANVNETNSVTGNANSNPTPNTNDNSTPSSPIKPTPPRSSSASSKLRGRLKRASSRTDIVKKPDPKFDSSLLTIPGAERAIIWEYTLTDPEKIEEGIWKEQDAVVKLERRPFAEGGLRTVYHIRNLATPDVPYVAKFSKNSSHGRVIYENDIEMQEFCRLWADKFNSENPPKKIAYVKAYLLELLDRTSSNFGILEPLIEGEYRKYSNNQGLVQYNRNTPQAFSHYTYEKSNHDFVIVDIQGVDDLYTDPQIHTLDQQRFGVGNFGKKGIVKFLVTHVCNAVCDYLKLPNANKDASFATHNLSKGTMPFPKDLLNLLELQRDNIKLGQEAEPPKIDLTSFSCINTLRTSKLTCLCLTERYLYGGADDGGIVVLDLESLTLKDTLKGHVGSVDALCYNDQYLFSGSSDKDIRLWSLTTHQCVKVIEEGTVAIKALSVDHRYLYCCSTGNTINVWSLNTYQNISELRGHEKSVKTLTISGSVLFSSGNDCTIKVWNTQTLQCIFNIDGHKKWIKTLKVYGRYLFSAGNDKKVKIWDLEKLELVKTLKPHDNKINCLVVSQDCLVTGSDDNTLKVIDLRTLEVVSRLSDHRGAIVDICMNDKYLFTASYNGVKIWNWKTSTAASTVSSPISIPEKTKKSYLSLRSPLSSRNPLCEACGKAVYKAEELINEKKIFHTLCFQKWNQPQKKFSRNDPLISN